MGFGSQQAAWIDETHKLALVFALLATARYVKAPNGRFTPQTLPGRGGLDARTGLTSMLCAGRA